MIAPDDPRDLQEVLMDLDPMQPELQLIWNHLQDLGWRLVQYPLITAVEVESRYTAVDGDAHALSGGSLTGAEVIERAALAQMLRTPDEAGRMGQLLLDAGWRSEVANGEMIMTLDQPRIVREGLMAVLDPDGPALGAQPSFADYPDNLNALVPGHPTAQAMLEVLAPRIAPQASWAEIRRAAGISVHGGSMGECVLAAIKKLEELTWT